VTGAQHPGPMVTSVGHGTLPAEDFAALLRGAGIERLVDVRRFPGSRKFPWFGQDQMDQWLPDAGVEYLRIGELGGRRRPTEDSPNTAWRTAQFAAYADHMATDEFDSGVRQLLSLAQRPSAVMCSESLWWRCHRRLIADHLVLVESVPVQHLFHDGRRSDHDPLAEAVVVDGHVEYPAG
jgi:uncharacterized protein (DUF488 family)